MINVPDPSKRVYAEHRTASHIAIFLKNQHRSGSRQMSHSRTTFEYDLLTFSGMCPCHPKVMLLGRQLFLIGEPFCSVTKSSGIL
jgi:hypothetical protein